MDLSTLDELFEELVLSGHDSDYDRVMEELEVLEKTAKKLLKPVDDVIFKKDLDFDKR